MTTTIESNAGLEERRVASKAAWKSQGRRGFDAPTAMKFVVKSGTGTPLHRFVDALLTTWHNPLGTGTVFPTTERLALSAGVSVPEVEAVIYDLEHHSATKSDAGIIFSLRRASQEAIAASTPANWKTEKAPVKLALRYPEVVDGDVASSLAHALCSSAQGVGKPYNFTCTREHLALRLGIAVEGVEAVVDGLRKRGWVVIAEKGNLLIGASDSLVQSWAAFNDAALVDRDGIKAGARETAYERVWEERVSGRALDRLTGTDEVLDSAPTGWTLYRLTDGEYSYIGITKQTLRSRLQHHLMRTGQGTTEKARNRGLITWLSSLSSQGEAPRIERIGSLDEDLDQAWVESMEHIYVQREVAERGSAHVLNLQHHPLHPGFCNHP